jgi:hypothetical protein
LLELLLAARISPAATKPRLVTAVQPGREHPPIRGEARQDWQQYHGTFHHRFLGEFIIRSEGRQLVMETGIGIFKLLPIGENQFWPPDIEIPLMFKQAEAAEKKHKIDSVLDARRKVTQVIFYY